MARRPGARPTGCRKLHTEQLLLFAAEEWGMTVRIGRHQSIFGPSGMV